MDLQEFERRMKGKTTIDPVTECWLYTGRIKESGYGTIMVNYVSQYVHRVSAAIYLNYNLLSTELQINHKCSNKNCWNPEHLYVGIQLENVHDALIMGTHGRLNKRKTHCNQGHELTEENSYIRSDGNSRRCRICDNGRKNEERKIYGT